MRSGSCRRRKGREAGLRLRLWWGIRRRGGVRLPGSAPAWWRNRGLGFTSWGVASPCSSAGVSTVIRETQTIKPTDKQTLPEKEKEDASERLLSFFAHFSSSFLPRGRSWVCFKTQFHPFSAVPGKREQRGRARARDTYLYRFISYLIFFLPR